MKTIKLNNEKPDKDLINEAIDVLISGGIVLYPTDTVYGLGANIFNEKAVKKIYTIKNRDFDKPLSVCISSFHEMGLIAEINNKHEDLIYDKLPGPFTFILYKKPRIMDNFLPKHKKIGVRIPQNNIALELSRIFPITSTSANISTENTLNTPEEINKQLNGNIDLAIDVGSLKSNLPSTVVDLTKESPNLLRQGLGKI